MKNFIKVIINFFKNIFGQDIKISVENNKKYDNLSHSKSSYLL